MKRTKKTGKGWRFAHRSVVTSVVAVAKFGGFCAPTTYRIKAHATIAPSPQQSTTTRARLTLFPILLFIHLPPPPPPEYPHSLPPPRALPPCPSTRENIPFPLTPPSFPTAKPSHRAHEVLRGRPRGVKVGPKVVLEVRAELQELQARAGLGSSPGPGGGHARPKLLPVDG